MPMTPTIQHILVPTDFSLPATDAVDYAAALADSLGARVHLVHVLEEPYVTHAPYAFHLADAPSRRDRLYEEAREALQRLRARFAERVVVTTEVRGGSATESILKAAVDYGADLIVMGTHGRTALQHLLAGSVAERVTRLARCPVLAVRGRTPAAAA
jgi:nucleotide-binding universal stress UspA family protein